MADLALRADGLGKRYRLGAVAGWRGTTLREALADLPARVWHAATARRRPASGPPEVWAVRDLRLEVARGEILGLVGANGSGKTTVLRLAAGITDPTEGFIATRGRVAALLEVGTAFHPDLTGRENILLNGIMLGMRAAAVRRRFDEIVEFAGVARFVDTPVKHYSSGMYMRLAFAVAIHLDADLLLVDEGLAVGDLEYQQKCLARIAAAREEGRTALLVTHSMAALRRLCTRAVLLEGGRLAFEGSAEEVARRYEGRALSGRRAPTPRVELPPGPADAAARARELRLADAAGRPAARFPAATPWRARLEIDVDRPVAALRAVLTVRRAQETALVRFPSATRAAAPGRFRVDFTCSLPLAPADLVVGVELWEREHLLYRADDAAVIEIAPGSDAPAVPGGPGILLAPALAEIRPAGAARPAAG